MNIRKPESIKIEIFVNFNYLTIVQPNKGEKPLKFHIKYDN